MKTRYLGLELRSPVIVGSSPYTADADHIRACARHGAGAVILKSIFEEQILRQSASLAYASDAGMGDAGEYLSRYLDADYRNRFLRLVRDAAATNVPVIASINCVASEPSWADYARSLAGEGAAALELNVFLLPTDRHTSSSELEDGYVEIVRQVVEAVPVPVSVKLPLRLTNILSVADRLLARGARGVVLFNRFFEPDIDIEEMVFTPSSPFSNAAELRNVLRSAALCTAAIPQLDLSVSTGIHDGPAAVKGLLCGARTVQLCTAIRNKGYEAIGTIDRFIDRWAARHGFDSIEAFRGRMSYGSANDDLLQRVQYMQHFPNETAL